MKRAQNTPRQINTDATRAQLSPLCGNTTYTGEKPAEEGSRACSKGTTSLGEASASAGWRRYGFTRFISNAFPSRALV